MATLVHNDWLDGMLGSPTHNVVDIDTDTMKLSLLDATDSGTITAAYVDYAEINGVVVVSDGLAMPSVSTITDGVVTLSGAATFLSVSGDVADYMTLWKDTASAATSTLLITWDTASSGLPVTPNGGDIISTWGSNILLTLA